MLYTVKDVAKLSGVTIKALHHYHKIGLLEPCHISEAGYRLYGENELERLQQILFYRELEFSLNDIKKALENEPNRIECLIKQQEMIISRRQRMDDMLNTIKVSIESSMKGEIMDKSEMFKGLNKEQWEDALSEQREYIKDKYKHDILENNEIEIQSMNEKAAEAQDFLNYIKKALISKWKTDDERLQKRLKEHITFLNKSGISIDEQGFVQQTRFFLQDDFHREMLENMQIGLGYYLCVAAEVYANKI